MLAFAGSVHTRRDRGHPGRLAPMVGVQWSDFHRARSRWRSLRRSPAHGDVLGCWFRGRNSPELCTTTELSQVWPVNHSLRACLSIRRRGPRIAGNTTAGIQNLGSQARGGRANVATRQRVGGSGRAAPKRNGTERLFFAFTFGAGGGWWLSRVVSCCLSCLGMDRAG